jgi:hypothetical protein
VTPCPWWFRALDWAWVFVVCRVLGRHMWIWRDLLFVPFYGHGAWECADCGKVKVRPCP